MANGDAAAAAGLATFAPTQDIRLGYDNDNIRVDELAAHLTNGTHPASAINSGVLSVDRIPTITNAKIQDGAITNNKIQDGAVSDGKITTVSAGKVDVGGGVSVTSWASGTFLPKNGPVTFTGALGVSGTFSMGGSMYNGQVYNQTNTGRAVYVASDGLFGVGSSSRRFKKNITDADLDVNAILQIAVRTFNYKKSFENDDSTIHIGVIAEELVELGLEAFVFFDENGIPDGVAYDKLALAALAAIQTLTSKLETIEQRITALESN